MAFERKRWLPLVIYRIDIPCLFLFPNIWRAILNALCSWSKITLITSHNVHRRLRSTLQGTIPLLHICNLLHQTSMRSHYLLYPSSVFSSSSVLQLAVVFPQHSSCMADLRLQR